MSTGDLRNASLSGSSTPPLVAPNYGSTVPRSQGDSERPRYARAATGGRFLSSIHGLLNMIIILALLCVIISASLVTAQSCVDADNSSIPSKAKISAYNTRNCVIAFAVLGFTLLIVDTVLHVSGSIENIPTSFDLLFLFVLFLFGLTYLILGCCAAAWEQKMDDTVKREHEYEYEGAAAIASFFLFVAMFAVFINFSLRCTRLTGRN